MFEGMEIPIRTPKDLDNVRNNLERNFRLINDIDLSNIENWQPIGTAAAPFTGTLDGNGFTIRNLTIDRPAQDSIGLFGVNRGEIRNLTLENVRITGRNITGSLVGQNHALGELYNVTVRNIIRLRGNNTTGGLTGQNAGNLTNVSVIGGSEIRGNSPTGGLVGSNNGLIISGSAVYIDHLTGGTVGGLVGNNRGTVRLSYYTNHVLGTVDIGGLIGNMGAGLVEQSYATGGVTGRSSNAGGFIGRFDGGTIRNSFSTGNVQEGGINAGFVGSMLFSAMVENSYSLSNNPRGFSARSSSYVNITRSFFELDRLVFLNNPNLEHGRTREQMQQMSTFVGWDFDTIWEMGSNGYPVLRGMPMTRNYISIYTATDLDNIRYNLSRNYRLINDIDLSGVNWQPINSFVGSLDGNDFAIRNLNIDRSSQDNIGLFGINHGEIRNLTLENVRVVGRARVGSLIGNNTGNLYNVTVRNVTELRGDTNTGGFAGQNAGNLINVAVIDGTDFRGISTAASGSTGGLVGSNRGLIVRGSSVGVVGLMGRTHTGGLIGYNHGTIRLSYSTNNVHVSGSVGGLIGIMRSGLVEQSYATGNITGTSSSGGGFIGHFAGGIIRNSFSTGNVQEGVINAGFVGSMLFSAMVENSYSLSNNSRGFSTRSTSHANITKSFFELDRLAVKYRNLNLGQGRTRVQMQQRSTFDGWNFDTIWEMGAGKYPSLRGLSAPHTEMSLLLELDFIDESSTDLYLGNTAYADAEYCILRTIHKRIYD